MKKKENTTFIPPSSVIPDLDDPKANVTPTVKDSTPKAGKQPKGSSGAPDDKKPKKTVKKAANTSIPRNQTGESGVSRLFAYFQHKPMDDAMDTDGLSPMEQVCRKSGLNEDDVNMMFELGYENELGRLVGNELLNQLRYERMKTEGTREAHRYHTSFGYRGNEFSANEQRDTVLAAYAHDRKHVLVRLLATLLCTALLFFLEQPTGQGYLLTLFPTAAPWLFDLLSLVVLLAACLFSVPQIMAGLLAFFKFSPTPYSVPAFIAPISLAYGVARLFSHGEMIRVGFLVALLLWLTSVSDMLRIFGELRVFRLLSTDNNKTVLEETTPRKKKLRQGDRIVKVLNDDIGKSFYRIRKSPQTRGFFRRFNDMSSAARPFMILIVGMLAVTVLSGYAAALYTSDYSRALSIAMTVLMISAPATACLGYFYPLFRANRVLAHKSCALVGEEGAEELTGDTTVVFSDAALYSAQKKQEIAHGKSSELQSDLGVANALLVKLDILPASALSPIADPTSLTVAHIADNGVEAYTDQKRKILAGSAEYMQQNNVTLPQKADDEESPDSRIAVLYVAIDGALKVSYELEYTANEHFEGLVQALADSRVHTAVITYDPSLTDAFVQQGRDPRDASIRVLKHARYEEDRPMEMIDTAAVALGEDADITYPMHAAHAISEVHRFAWRMQLIASILGTAGVALLTVFHPTVTLDTMAVLAYQAFWTVVMILSAHSELNEARFHFHK